MLMRRYLSLFGLVFCLSATGILRADILDSVAGLSGVCLYDGTGTSCAPAGNTVAITPHPSWQANNPSNPGASDNSAVWISYAPTGYGDSTFVPFKGNIPVFALTQTFSAGIGETLRLHVWADDTAGVYLDNVELMAPVFTQSVCSGQPIGCLSKDFGNFIVPLTTAGTHTLRFDVYQVGTGSDTTSNPMGLLYTGAVPDGGATLMLLGGVLVGIETLRRRFRV